MNDYFMKDLKIKKTIIANLNESYHPPKKKEKRQTAVQGGIFANGKAGNDLHTVCVKSGQTQQQKIFQRNLKTDKR